MRQNPKSTSVQKGGWLEFRRLCEISCLYPFCPVPNRPTRFSVRVCHGETRLDTRELGPHPRRPFLAVVLNLDLLQILPVCINVLYLTTAPVYPEIFFPH